MLNFEWDEEKNRANIRKHGVDFADAHEIFDLPLLVGLTNESCMAKIGSSALVSCDSE